MVAAAPVSATTSSEWYRSLAMCMTKGMSGTQSEDEMSHLARMSLATRS